MARGQSLQDPFLNALRKERVPVSIYLVNGIKLQGQVDSFDQFVVLLKNSVSQMVYKHAISTVVPARNVRLPSAEGAEEEGASRRRRPLDRGAGRNPCSNGLSAANAPYSSASGSARRRTPRSSASSTRSRARRARCRSRRSRASRRTPDPRYFVGSGKAEEIRDRVAGASPPTSCSWTTRCRRARSATSSA